MNIHMCGNWWRCSKTSLDMGIEVNYLTVAIDADEVLAAR